MSSLESMILLSLFLYGVFAGAAKQEILDDQGIRVPSVTLEDCPMYLGD